MADHVFPEDQGTNSGIDDPGYGDNDDAANFASAFESPNNSDYVLRGLEFTPDFSAGTVDISAGKARVSAPTAGTSQSGEIRDQRVVWTTEVDARSGLNLGSGRNYVYLDVLLEADDSLVIEINTTETAPSDPSLYLGWVDTDTTDHDDTINRNPDGVFENLEATEPPENGTDVARKTEVDAVGTDLSEHENETAVHGANGAIQGENDVSSAIESHRQNGVHSEPQPAADHAQSHHEGGGDELDASDLSGANGTDGQVLQTDGQSASWKNAGITESDAKEIAAAQSFVGGFIHD